MRSKRAVYITEKPENMPNRLQYVTRQSNAAGRRPFSAADIPTDLRSPRKTHAGQPAAPSGTPIYNKVDFLPFTPRRTARPGTPDATRVRRETTRCSPRRTEREKREPSSSRFRPDPHPAGGSAPSVFQSGRRSSSSPCTSSTRSVNESPRFSSTVTVASSSRGPPPITTGIGLLSHVPRG